MWAIHAPRPSNSNARSVIDYFPAILQNEKTPGGIIILHKCTINDTHHMMYGSWDMLYIVPEIWRVMDVILIFHLGYFLPFYPPSPLTTQKTIRHIILHMRTKIYNQMYGSWYMQHDGWIDGGTKRVAYWGGCPI